MVFSDRGSIRNAYSSAARKFLIMEVPSYGNSIFYSLGFLALTCLAILATTGLTMIWFGSAWWLAAPAGMFFRSVHLWAAQAFVLIVILHVLVVFSTSGFKPPRRFTWVVGSILFALALFEAEFGYDLRGDFSSQYRALQGADFFNGAYLGKVLSTLDQAQAFGIHVIIIPAVMLGLVILHYGLVKLRGIAKPYRPDVRAATVPADHRRLFGRGIVLTLVIIVLAAVFPSPLVLSVTIKEVANENPSLVAETLIAEFARTSNTATYDDSIDPYTFDTRQVFILAPYQRYAATAGIADELTPLLSAPAALAQANLAEAQAYFQNNDRGSAGGESAVAVAGNPLISAVAALTLMAKSGAYETALAAEDPSINPTYALRFLADTGVLDTEAENLHITTAQWGMMREESGAIPPGAWWLAPLGFLDHTILANDTNGDRDGAEILGALVLLLILFPYLPYVNRLPEKLHLAERIWKAR